ncbi:MAG: hypothetical protein GY832_22500 [Chloroflexi bacterium]|nr:hypothetical protein [Chloroflexota bacterium]
MTIELHDPVNGDGLFDILGKAFFSIDTINTSRETTVPDTIFDFIEQFQLKTDSNVDMEQAMTTIPSAITTYQQSGGSPVGTISQACQTLLIEIVKADTLTQINSLTGALEYLIDQMETNGDFVDGSTPTLSLAIDGDNGGDAAIVYSEYRGDGKLQENMLGETVDITVDGTNTTAVFAGDDNISGLLAQNWPTGSGVNQSIILTEAASSLLPGGDFEQTDYTDLPKGWIVGSGTIGDTIEVTSTERQTIVIAGSPSSGHYVLNWQNAQGVTRATDVIAWDANASVVQAALRSIIGLEKVEVSATGTSPNYTHTVSFMGVGGDPATLTSFNHMDAGTIAHAITVPGDVGSYIGRSLRINSDQSTKVEMYYPLDLENETVYFCHFRTRLGMREEQSSSSSSNQFSSSSSSEGVTSSSTSDGMTSSTSDGITSSTSNGTSSSEGVTSSTSDGVTSSTSEGFTSSTSEGFTSSSTSLGSTSSQSSSQSDSTSGSNTSSSSSENADEIRVEIVEQIDGPTTVDSEGNENGVRFQMVDVNTLGHDSRFFSFRLQKTVRQPVYLHISAQPFNYDESLYIGELAVVRGIELYSGGPFVAAFKGVNPAEGDEYTLTSTNNRAGEFQEWFNRVFDMASKGLLLPAAKELIVNGIFAESEDIDGWTDQDTGTGESIYSAGTPNMSLVAGASGVAKRAHTAAILLKSGAEYLLAAFTAQDDIILYDDSVWTSSGNTNQSKTIIGDGVLFASDVLSFRVEATSEVANIYTVSLRRLQDVGKTIVTAIPDSLIG